MGTAQFQVFGRVCQLTHAVPLQLINKNQLRLAVKLVAEQLRRQLRL